LEHLFITRDCAVANPRKGAGMTVAKDGEIAKLEILLAEEQRRADQAWANYRDVFHQMVEYKMLLQDVHRMLNGEQK
jgi:hypothetical protein